MHQFVDDIITEEKIKERSNILQVTVKNRGMAFDLNQEQPTSIKEIPGMDDLLDPEYYVETGFTPQNIARKTGAMGEKYLHTLEIRPDSSGGLYYLHQDYKALNNPSDTETNNKKKEGVSPFLGCYRSYCEMDYLDISNMLECVKQAIPIKKIDWRSIICNMYN